jgi:ribosomal-protein-alanine N-acetyltransferase
VARLVEMLSELGVREVKAWVDTRNLASIRLVERVGLTRFDKLIEADHFKGSSSDEWFFARQLQI